jgi:hypothetical protein
VVGDKAGALLLEKHEPNFTDLYSGSTGKLNLLKGNHAGAASPTLPSNGQGWYDSTDKLFQIYDSSLGWGYGGFYSQGTSSLVTLEVGTATISAGTATLSSLVLTGDSVLTSVVTKTGGYTMTSADCGKTLIADLTSAATFTYPVASAVSSGCSIVSKNTSTWTLTVYSGTSTMTVGPSGQLSRWSNGVDWHSDNRWIIDETFTVRSASTVTAPYVIPVTGADGLLSTDFVPAVTMISATTNTTPATVNVKTKILYIGDWDMDANELTVVPHGLTLSKIVGLTASIITDDSAQIINLFYDMSTETGQMALGSTATQVYLHRKTSGVFDSTDFNSTSFNRGYVVITYLE